MFLSKLHSKRYESNTNVKFYDFIIKVLAEFEVAGVIICTGPGALVVGDVCTCPLTWTIFNADIGGCECIAMNGEEETGLAFNADIGQCACGAIVENVFVPKPFEFINERGLCRSFQVYHSFILQFLAVYKEKGFHIMIHSLNIFRVILDFRFLVVALNVIVLINDRVMNL